MKLERHDSRSFTAHVSHAVTLSILASFGFVSCLATGQSNAQIDNSTDRATTARTSTGLEAGQETFSSAAEATHAVVRALIKDDEATLLKILGANAKEIISSGDGAEDKTNRDQFVQKYQQMHRLVTEPDGTTTLYIGAENWPTPIPLLRQGNSWYFDTAAGKQEILYRRVGKNEMAVMQTCHELMDAEKEYYAQPHEGIAGSQYAQKFFSDPGKQNGLYWESASDKASPIGPLIAVAATDGYPQAPARNLEPFQGYYFRILKAQGSKASGGSRNYIVDGKMTGGFAFVAYPAEYRSSGVMTFIVNQDGQVYEKDLGPKTAEAAKTMKRYDPGTGWRKAE